MIHNLFPTPIGFYELDSPVTAEELAFVKGLEKRPNMGNVTSVDRKSTRLNSSHVSESRMPSSA